MQARPIRLRKKLFGVAVFIILPLVVACGEKHKNVPLDAGLVAPPPVVDATVLLLDDPDTGVDAADAADAHKKVGPAGNTNVLRLKQCCGQLRIQAKALGASPEAGLLTQAAAQCDGLAAQAGTSGNAPELGILRTALAGRNIPPVCAGF
jgi:hypothetical protein